MRHPKMKEKMWVTTLV